MEQRVSYISSEEAMEWRQEKPEGRGLGTWDWAGALVPGRILCPAYSLTLMFNPYLQLCLTLNNI